MTTLLHMPPPEAPSLVTMDLQLAEVAEAIARMLFKGDELVKRKPGYYARTWDQIDALEQTRYRSRAEVAIMTGDYRVEAAAEVQATLMARENTLAHFEGDDVAVKEVIQYACHEVLCAYEGQLEKAFRERVRVRR